VVTAAAAIMISVFAAFVPHGDSSVQPIALGLAVGVFVDAFLVRMTLVPAVLALLGDRAWRLPGWLDRRLPVVDVEGVGLARQLEHEGWLLEHGPVTVRAEQATLLEGDRPVFGPVDVVLRPGELLAVCTADRVARRALLAALTGRLDLTHGRLVVQDRVLPVEAAAVRRRVRLRDRFPTREELARLEDAAETGATPLLVVDDVDLFASEDEVRARWASLERLTGLGAAVVAGCRGGAPRQARVLTLDTRRSPIEEASL
jgi:RND superfamily putative drug exporter